MKRAILSAALVTVMACGGGPTAPANASIGGSYDLTITVSSTCSANLPAEARELKYIANITQTGAAFQAQLLAHVIWNSVTIIGTVSGQTITFSTFAVDEVTTGGGVALATSGAASVAANASMTGALSGPIQSRESGAICNATNHQITLVKK